MKYHEFDSGGNVVTLVERDKWEWIDYPEDNFVSERSGFKVGWRTYSVEESAKECAYAAAINAILKEREGFDFGYHIPSTVTKVDAGWEVVIP